MGSREISLRLPSGSVVKPSKKVFKFFLLGSPPPVPRNHLAQEPPPGSTVKFSTSPSFSRVMGFDGSGGCRTAIQVCGTTKSPPPNANGPPMPMPPPLCRKKKHPPPDIFFTKSHTNCLFLPTFLSVQWHMMGTILGVMCLVFNTDFHFSKCCKTRMEQTEIVPLSTQAVSSGC